MKFSFYSKQNTLRGTWWKLAAAVAALSVSNLGRGSLNGKNSAFATAFSPSSSIAFSSQSSSINRHLRVPFAQGGAQQQQQQQQNTNNRRRPSFSSVNSALAMGFWNDLFPSGKYFAGALATLVLALNCACTVDVGQIGIASTFGSIERYDPGLHFRTPFVSKIEYLSTKTELLEQSNFVPTKEGLTVELDTAVLVRLDPQEALKLYESVGPNFVQKLVIPEASSSIRGLTSESEAKALYTAGRSEIQNKLKSELKERLGSRGIVVEDVLLKNVVLPTDLSASIQEKARAEQESARMEFVLRKEKQEAERKAIEAEGIAEFQRIVTKGITPSLLQWKGIEATEKLAESPNTKVVIMGNSKDSLPVILGGKE
uniref:Band 7 domain-containing protein n=1 Tax=Pseudo-nitzschia australis TaxID=44445 RepID=A0A7S4ATR7_9STRA|mmetsp:Transcript_7010/g.14929  ORF Transcript_7010/g.14929 Transcript_7010/m.14929 type:complete len:371 (+) Transcript_7010:223-1335(+)